MVKPVWLRFVHETRSARHNTWFGIMAEIVAKGEAEIGMQQINVILPVAGADYVGPLPAELQRYVDFAVGVLAVSKQRDAAQALVKFMSSPEAAPLIRKSGMEPPPH
jgi:molybdate transport system substrate-binding protein